jgi:hypothetical protein
VTHLHLQIAGCCLATTTALTAPTVNVPKLDPSQVTVPFVVENAKAVAGIGMAVLGTGFLVMILLSLLGNHGLNHNSNDEAYAPAVGTVEVHAHRPAKVRYSTSNLFCPAHGNQLVMLLSTGSGKSSATIQGACCCMRTLPCIRHSSLLCLMQAERTHAVPALLPTVRKSLTAGTSCGLRW